MAEPDVLETFRAERAAICQMLTARRRELGWSQADVADRMGTTQSAVSDFETGRVEPRLDSLQRWAHALGADLAVTLRIEAAGSPASEPVRDADGLKVCAHESDQPTRMPLMDLGERLTAAGALPGGECGQALFRSLAALGAAWNGNPGIARSLVELLKPDERERLREAIRITSVAAVRRSQGEAPATAEIPDGAAELKVYATDAGEYVMADGAGWLPGTYPDVVAAVAAYEAMETDEIDRGGESHG